VAWKGARDSAEEAAAERAAAEVGLEPVEVRRVRPFEAARDRHLHVFRKIAPTPERFPRRAGMAAKRPLG
jgi:16S rRNA (guanine527-N7)-methyltransferase